LEVRFGVPFVIDVKNCRRKRAPELFKRGVMLGEEVRLESELGLVWGIKLGRLKG